MTEFYSFLEQVVYDHECVIIPSFGGFVVNAEGFSYNEKEGKIHPKKKCIAFNEKLKTDDRLLSTEWAKKKSISSKEASVEIQAWSKELKAQLVAEGELTVGNLGTFTLNPEKRISFAPNSAFNADLTVFGLFPVGLGHQVVAKPKKPELIAPPIAEDLPTQTLEELQPVKMSKSIYVYAVIAFILGGLGAFFLTAPATNQSQSSLNPIKLERKEVKIAPVVSNEKEKVQTDTLSSKTLTAPVAPEMQAANDGDIIYLVAASFQSFEQAEKGLKAFKSMGFDQAEIILKNEQSKFYRISLGTEHSMEAGYAKAIELKKSKKVDIWVYKAL